MQEVEAVELALHTKLSAHFDRIPMKRFSEVRLSGNRDDGSLHALSDDLAVFCRAFDNVDLFYAFQPDQTTQTGRYEKRGWGYSRSGKFLRFEIEVQGSLCSDGETVYEQASTARIYEASLWEVVEVLQIPWNEIMRVILGGVTPWVSQQLRKAREAEELKADLTVLKMQLDTIPI